MRKGLSAYRQKWENSLRRKLEGLSPKNRLRLVVAASAVLALCSLCTIGTAVCGFGSGGNGADIGHIEKLDLPKRQEVINLYNNMENGKRNGTEREDSPERQE